MNGKRSGLAWFVGVILLIVAFAKGQWRDILLLVVFGVCGTAFAGYLIARTIRKKQTKQKTDKERAREKRSRNFEAPICNVLLLIAGLLFVWCFIEDYVKWSIGLLSLWAIYFAGTTAMAHRRELVTALRRAQTKTVPFRQQGANKAHARNRRRQFRPRRDRLNAARGISDLAVSAIGVPGCTLGMGNPFPRPGTHYCTRRRDQN